MVPHHFSTGNANTEGASVKLNFSILKLSFRIHKDIRWQSPISNIKRYSGKLKMQSLSPKRKFHLHMLTQHAPLDARFTLNFCRCTIHSEFDTSSHVGFIFFLTTFSPNDWTVCAAWRTLHSGFLPSGHIRFIFSTATFSLNVWLACTAWRTIHSGICSIL